MNLPSTGAAGDAVAPSDSTRQIVLVTGLAGAGRTAALRALEDLGYEAVDNLPLALFPHLMAGLQAAGPGMARSVALGLDSRSRGFDPKLLLERARAARALHGWALRILYLECADDVLVRRFKETRRRHPLAPDRPAGDGIEEERALMAPVRASADLVIDTSDSTPSDLKRRIAEVFAEAGLDTIVVTIMSFSYRHGLPREADLVIDARFLRNPHYDEALRPLDGRDKAVEEFVAADPSFSGFFASLTELVWPRLPDYRREGKSYLTIAIGCTGGRHRSVVVAARLGDWLRAKGLAVNLRHRDLEKFQGTNENNE
jgi:UPF0042 nucleotide-binding protein